MLEAILGTVKLMGWLGIVLAILVCANTICGALSNIWSAKEEFSWKRLFQGLAKAAVFYLSAVLVSVALTMLPFINEMITSAAGEVLISADMLQTLSSVGILGTIVSVIVVQAQKAIKNIAKLANIESYKEVITWDVEEPEEDAE